MEKIDAMHQDPDNIEVHYDYPFHLAIAKAADNVYYHRFLQFLQPIIVPRFRLGRLVRQELKDEYYSQIHEEHEAVVVSIEQQNPDAARECMHAHLLNSLERLRAVAQALGLGDKSTQDTEQLTRACGQ